MTIYKYIVSGVEPEKTFRGAASSDAAARQEAVLFLSEILRETPLSEGGAFSLHVVVESEGREVCRLKASAH
ncbi:hypothetical protein D3C71_2072090 [compost metagenome]